jgi:hypothetical protein
MLPLLQDVGVAETPLKVTVLVPCVAPKFVPVIVTDAPTAPEVGVSVLIIGVGGTTVKLTPLLATPDTVTTTFPVVAPLGTGTEMLVELQLVGVAAVPLNVTVLAPCVEPNAVPAMVTAAPIGPEVGDRLVMLGACASVRIGKRRNRDTAMNKIGFQLSVRMRCLPRLFSWSNDATQK